MNKAITKVQLPRMHTLSEQIGRRIRDARKSRGLTLDALARDAGFTKSYLSKIENARKVPPIASLARICRSLDTKMADLLDESTPEGDAKRRYSVVRADERQTVIRGKSAFGYDYKSLVHRLPSQHMEPFLFTFPERIGEEVSFEHEGEELVFVLSGQVRFFLDGEELILDPGDALYFDSTVRHRGEAVDHEAKALVVIYSSER